MALLEFKNVEYSSEGKSILQGVNFKVEKGDFYSIVGHSGSGKSTILKMCCSLKSISDGEILYKDKNICEYDPSKLRMDVAYCFQMPNLFGRTVAENLSFPFLIRNQDVDMNRINELFQMFKMKKELANEQVVNLSGGEKQRIALIRTLMFTPEILLLDEVTSALDAENTRIVEENIAKLNERGTTILWVTHNSEQSRKHANKILTMDGGKISSLEVL